MPLSYVEMERLAAYYSDENGRLMAALARLTRYLPANVDHQSEGTVAIPIRELKAARDWALGRGPFEEAAG